jgi:opacity protein-like surface antigen
VLSATIASCTRSDADVGGAGFCPEFSLAGVDVPLGFRLFGLDWHFGAEVGLGFMSRSSSGDANFGVARSSGGTYLVVRALLGFDVTRLFYVRVGAQARGTWSLETVNPGGQAVVDLGTRLGNHWEVGVRGILGEDGVVATGNGETRHDTALAYGAGVAVRLFVP